MSDQRPMSPRELNDLVMILERNRDEALERQTRVIKELFDAKMGAIQNSVIQLSSALSKHVDDDRMEFSRVYSKLEPMQQTLALTKVKLAAVIAAAGTVAGAVSAFVVKHFMSIVVTK